MAKAGTQDILGMKKRLIQSSLDLAAKTSWVDVSIDDIAAHADVKITDAVVLCPDKQSILMAYGYYVDSQLADNFSNEIWDGMSDKDRLFDVLMDRFDILNENRAGVVSIINAVTLDPRQAICHAPMICQSMENVSKIANVSMDGLMGSVKLTALSALYLKILRDWVRDDSVDMPITMANLDKALGYLDKINI